MSFPCPWVRKGSVQEQRMSSARNRSQSGESPQVSQRILQHDLEGVGEAMTAFDGFKSAGPVLESMVLQRPIDSQQRSFLEQLVYKARNLFGLVRSWR
ncbi:hypothetical protein sync_2410 [Synechococcus sp. CC9311]|nr:hypothetical protein sync_2410 [Synechococcus sp. CC9311]